MTINVPAPFNSICYKILIKSVIFLKLFLSTYKNAQNPSFKTK